MRKLSQFEKIHIPVNHKGKNICYLNKGIKVEDNLLIC